jgi:hypothetical protein
MPTRESAFITVLYSLKTRQFLGKGGKWMSCDEFQKNPPQKPDDIVPVDPDPGTQTSTGPDPGPRYVCIEGTLHICYGNRCTDLGEAC